MTREEAVKRIKRFLEERNENCDEDELYVIHDRITDSLKLYHGKSPKEAYLKMMEGCKLWVDDPEEEEGND